MVSSELSMTNLKGVYLCVREIELERESEINLRFGHIYTACIIVFILDGIS